MMLPIQKLATRPQNISGLLEIRLGPGVMPWISSAPRISAIVALPGMPRVSVGMKAVMDAALLEDSGAVMPSIAPVPNFSGLRESFFSTA